MNTITLRFALWSATGLFMLGLAFGMLLPADAAYPKAQLIAHMPRKATTQSGVPIALVPLGPWSYWPLTVSAPTKADAPVNGQ